MKKVLLILNLLCASLCAFGGKPIVVIDGSHSSPIEGATVISDRGIILGITNAYGSINVNPAKDFPLEIRSVGFEPTSIIQYSDTIRLSPATYELPEINIQPDDHPILKMTCYAREYSSGATQTDTIQFYGDYMFVGYITEGKVKGFKSGDRKLNIRNERRFARFSNSEGLDSVCIPEAYNDLSLWMSCSRLLLGIPLSTIEETEKIRSGATADTIMGKYSASEFIRKNDDLYSINYDILSGYKDHKFSPWFAKAVGMTFEMDKLQRTYAFKTNSEGKYNYKDFIYGCGSLHEVAKGKLFKHFLHQKSDLEIDGYAEMYIIDVEYLTVEEYKEEKKDTKERKKIPFQEPKNLQPLPPSIKRIIERLNY